jgi:outer membrane protein TolC
MYEMMIIQEKQLNKLHRSFKIIGFLILFIFGFNQKLFATDNLDLKTRLEAESESLKIPQLQFNSNGGLDHYLHYTASQNPALKSAYYRVKAAFEKVGYSASLPDPMISFGYYFESVETRVGPQNKRYGIKQTIPWIGSLSSKKNIAYAEAQIAFSRFQAIKFKIFYQLKKAFYDYYLLGRERAITEENMELLLFWESVTRTKYKLALSQHSDLIKVQLELGQLEDKLLTLDEKISSSETRLRTLMNLPDTIMILLPDSINIDVSVIDKESITQLVFDNNPDINALFHSIKKEEQSVSLVSKQSYPNFTFGIDYIETGEAIDPSMNESGKDPWMVSVQINVPIWFGKNKAKTNEARARQKAADNNLVDKRNELKYYVEYLLVEHDDFLRKIQLYRNGLIPKAEQLLNATYTSYQADKTDFLNLLEAQRQLLKLQIEYDSATTNLAITKARLEMISGQKLK